MSVKSNFYEMSANKIIEAMKKRDIEAYYCETKEDGLKKALELIPEKSTVTWGGSQSIKEIGLTDALSNGNYTVYDRANASTQEEIKQIYIKAFSCDYYLASSNAVSLDGKLINIDGTGNRVAAMIYGPKNVILVVGMNKVEKDEDLALSRVRNKASVMNAMRIGVNTPCVKSPSCYDCLSEECICCQTVVTRKSKIKNRIKVILVGEELGY